MSALLIIGGLLLLSYGLQPAVQRMKDNTKVWGDWFISFTATTWRKAGPPVQRAWINETQLPDGDAMPRHGEGWLVRVLPTVAVSFGRWAPLDPDESAFPFADEWQKLPPIKEWKASLKRVA